MIDLRPHVEQYVSMKRKCTLDSALRDEMLKFLSYDNGKIFNKKSNRYVGGAPSSNGYVYAQIRIGGFSVTSTLHRFIWLLEKGETPIEIDHINGARDDNRIENLRASNPSLNQLNRHKKTGNSQDLPIGVYRCRRAGRPGMWYVVAVSSGNKRYSSSFRDKDKAIKAASDARASFFNEKSNKM